MTRIVVRGGRTDRDLADLPTGAEAHSDLVKSTVKSAFDVEVSRGGGSRHPVIEDAAPDDVLELTLSDGVRMWTSVEQMGIGICFLTPPGVPRIPNPNPPREQPFETSASSSAPHHRTTSHISR